MEKVTHSNEEKNSVPDIKTYQGHQDYNFGATIDK
jgi:hypothetical protein